MRGGPHSKYNRNGTLRTKEQRAAAKRRGNISTTRPAAKSGAVKRKTPAKSRRAKR